MSRKANRKYRQTEAGKEVRRKGAKEYQRLYPEKHAAHSVVRRALISGKLVRPDHCEFCFKECKPESHHEDYSKPLEIDWLCIECHSKQGVKV